MDREHIQPHRKEAISGRFKEFRDGFLVGLYDLDEQLRFGTRQGLLRALQDVQFHAFDIDLDEIDAGKVE